MWTARVELEMKASDVVDEYRFAARDKTHCGQMYLFWSLPGPIGFLFRRGSAGRDIAARWSRALRLKEAREVKKFKSRGCTAGGRKGARPPPLVFHQNDE
jgi:hypothetical protein